MVFFSILGYAFVQNSIFSNKLPNKDFPKRLQISTCTPKNEFKRSFPTHGGNTFGPNSISYNQIPSQISHKIAQISTNSPKTEFEWFHFLPLATHLLKIQFFPINYLAKLLKRPKILQIATYTAKNEFKRFFPTHGGDTFGPDSISYKQISSQISHKSFHTGSLNEIIMKK